MTEKGPIEAELSKVAKFKPRDYPERQDELAALLRAMEKVTDEAFNQLSDKAADWYNEAADAVNNNDDIPEPDPASDDNETSDDTDHEAEEAAQDAAADAANDDADEDEEVTEEELEADDEEEAEAPPPPPKAKGKSVDRADKREKSTKDKPKKAAPVEDSEPEEVEAGSEDQEPPPVKHKPPKHLTSKTTPYDNLSGEKDRYGVHIGTNTSKAIQMYEAGASVKQVFDVLGGRYRNILNKLVKDGHMVEKFEGGVYKVTHKDDFGAKAKGKKK